MAMSFDATHPHSHRSGYTGPWGRSPTTFSNEYFRLLIDTKWVPKQWKGPKQFENTDGSWIVCVSVYLSFSVLCLSVSLSVFNSMCDKVGAQTMKGPRKGSKRFAHGLRIVCVILCICDPVSV